MRRACQIPILQKAPSLEKIVYVGPNLEKLVLGYDIGEGPMWLHEKEFLFSSEVKGNKIWMWAPNDGLILLKEQTNNANGLT